MSQCLYVCTLCKGMDADHVISRGELNDKNNSIACLLYNFSQHEYSVIGPTFIVSYIVNLLSSTVAIVLVLVTMSYLVTIYRIIVYLSIAAILFLIGSGVMFIPYVLQEPMSSIYNMIMFSLTAYSSLVYALVLCWIGVHVFLLAVCGVHLQKTKHELFPIAGVLLLPLIVTWAIPVYTSGPCTFNPSFLIVVLCSVLVPYVISTILAALTVISVILSLCKGLLKVKKVNRRALKELAPYLLFIIIQNIHSILLLTYYALMMKKERMEILFGFSLIETLVFAVSIISIPLLLLSQPHIRSRLKSKMCHCKCGGKEEGILPTTTQRRQTTVQQSATSGSSQTQYCVPPETSFTEEEPLIIKQ